MREPLLIRTPSSSGVKLTAIDRGFVAVRPHRPFHLDGLAVELQDRSDLSINAQPFGLEETLRYARARYHYLCLEYGTTAGLDVVIESGAVEGLDVAVVALYLPGGEETVVLSKGVPFPAGSLEEAQKRGFKTTTAGDIIHEWHPEIPANSWQHHFPPYLSREEQIQEAVERGLQAINLP